MIQEITSREEFEKIISEDKPTLVDFYATWCNPCKLQSPILHEFSQELEGKINVLKVDVDANEEIAFIYQVVSIPTLMVFKKGEIKEKTVGLTPKAQLSELLIKHI